jgi:putative ABC transport system permease protein
MRSLFRSLSLRYWRSRWNRALLLLLSIALGSGIWVATSALSRSLDHLCREATVPLGGAADLYVSNGDAGVPRDLQVALTATPGVRAVQPLVVQRVTLPDQGQQQAMLLGVDLPAQGMDDTTCHVEVDESAANESMRGALLGYKPALVGRELARRLPADSPRFNVLIAGRTYRFTRIGAIDAQGAAAALAGNVLVVPSDLAASLLDRPESVSRFDIFLAKGADREQVRQTILASVPRGVRVWTPDNHDSSVQEMLSGLSIAFSLCGAGALVVGLFLVYNALAVCVAERRHDIGTLRALGATRGQIRRLFMGEAALLGLVGSLLGVPLGLGLARMALGPAQRMLSDIFLPLPAGTLAVGPGTVLGAVAAGMFTTLLAAVVPSLQAAWENPADALRCSKSCGVKRRICQIGSGLSLAVLGITSLIIKDSLPHRLGTYASLLLVLGALLFLIPYAAAATAWALQPLAQRLMGISGRLAADNLLRAPGRTGLVITALAAGITLLLQTGGVIRSNEVAIRSWIDASIAGELFITAGGPLTASGQTLPMQEGVGRLVKREVPEATVGAVRFRYLDWRQDGRGGRILLKVVDAETCYNANLERQPPLPELQQYHQLCELGSALVSENFAALYGIHVGDTLRLPGADGLVALRVVGTVTDYSCNRGTVLVDRAQYRREFDAETVDVVAVYLPKGMDVHAVRCRLQQAPWAAPLALCIMGRPELRGHILNMVHRLYAVAYVQEIVVAVVAVLGLVAALLISVLQRRRELGLLRAVGATRLQVFRSVVVEALFMAVIGTGLGLLVGLPLEWYTLRVILFEEAGFLFPFQFPAIVLGMVVALAAIIAPLAGLGPAINAARVQIREAIAYE